MQKITPFLWYDDKAQEAATFYCSVFKDSKILSTMPGPGETAMGVTFQINGQELTAFNGGPMFKFNESISLFVNCETQEEVDYYWNSLIAGGGEPSRCGWLKDKYGLSWQIVPTALSRLLQDKDRVKAGRVMDAMMKMDKIIIADLEKAANS